MAAEMLPPDDVAGHGPADQGVADRRAMGEALATFLTAAGLPREARGEAPLKTAQAWADHLLVGYTSDPEQLLQPTWEDRGGQLVSITAIPFVSVCAHHLLPFFGTAHVAYLPGGRLTGLSRIEEMVHCLSRRLQVQERLGEEIAGSLLRGVQARGAACMLEAEHLCVFARGNPRSSVTRTLALVGEFEEHPEWHDRCLTWLSAGRAESPQSERERA